MGSDYPHLLGSIDKRSVSSIEVHRIPEREKERIFSGTALSILNNVSGSGRVLINHICSHFSFRLECLVDGGAR